MYGAPKKLVYIFSTLLCVILLVIFISAHVELRQWLTPWRHSITSLSLVR